MGVPRPTYPEALEVAWLRRAMKWTGAEEPETACDQLMSAVRELSNRFTTEREPGFGHYGASARLLAAYGLFFFPQTYVRTRLVLAECLREGARPGVERSGSLRCIDLGAGTGAAGLAVVDAFRAAGQRGRVHWVAVEHSGAAVRLAGELGRECHPRGRLTIEPVLADARTWEPSEPADLVIAAFSLNELFEGAPEEELVQWTYRSLRWLRPGGWLVLIEPATRPCALRLEHLRDRLVTREDCSILAPCPHRSPCPILALGNPNVWCHDVRRWSPPQSLRWINRRLHRDLQHLRWSFLAVRKTPLEPEPAQGPAQFAEGRLVGPVEDRAGRIRSHLCAADGSMRVCEILTRNLTKERRRELSRWLERGSRVRFLDPTTVGQGRILRGRDVEILFTFEP